MQYFIFYSINETRLYKFKKPKLVKSHKYARKVSSSIKSCDTTVESAYFVSLGTEWNSTNIEKYEVTEWFSFGFCNMGVSDTYELNEDPNYPDTN